jgi:Cu/Ag efflux protein CusF
MLRGVRARLVPFAFALVVALGGLAAGAVAPVGVASASEPQVYSTHGVVKSFGPNRAYVNIAHETIPGYMMAMTMSFEPRKDDQLAGIDVGARVAFTFTATDDGKRLLDRIAKE